MDKLIGTVLDGRYEIIKVIGVGGMSIVYKSTDLLENRFVAIKILRSEFVSEQKFRKRFLNESRAIAMLSHKNIVDVYDVNFEGGLQYIVMEYIDGRTLKDYLNEFSPLSAKEALAYCGQILNALRHAHERGVVHRDIKPQNIMLLENGIIKVTDFGIAHVSNFETVTMSDNAIGSVHYISPEQAKGHTTDERSDIYSTGVMLYEMITGKLPFEADTAVSVALMQVQKKPQKPSEICLDIPIGAEQIILKAMQKDINLRYQNAKEMQKDILKYFNDETIVFDYQLEQEIIAGDTLIIPTVGNAGEDAVSDNTAAANKSKKPKKLTQTEEDKPKTPEQELKRRKKISKSVIIRNRIIFALAGIFLAFIFIIIGVGTMFTVVQKLSGKLIDVPYLIGKSISDVKSDSILARDFTISESERYDDTVATGIIIEQSPEDGKYSSGKEIKVVVSKGQRMVNVPLINGVEEAQAIALLKERGLVPEKLTQTSSNVAEGKVIKSLPEQSSLVPVGTKVKIYISVSADIIKVKVPNVVGYTQQNALLELAKQQLVAKIIEEYNPNVKEGLVISQSIEEQTETDVNTEIIIYISKGAASAESSAYFESENMYG